MCYDISFTVNIKELEDYFPGLVYDHQIKMDFAPLDHIQGVSIFPEHPIIYTNRQDFKLHIRRMEWSAIEYNATTEPDMAKRNGMLNIRSERVLDDPNSYWFKIRNRRCLIPVSGIYEHRAVRGWKKKVPYLVRPKDQSVFFLPGLYSVAELPDKSTGEMIKRWTFALMTRAANNVMKHIHNDGDHKWRMPVFLPLEMAKEFISEELTVERYRQILAYEMPSEELYYHPVFTIRSPKLRPDNKMKHEYWDWEKLPALGEMNP